jgi:hypothetical protein
MAGGRESDQAFSELWKFTLQRIQSERPLAGLSDQMTDSGDQASC